MIYQFLQQGAQIFGSFVNPIALDAINWRYYLVYVVLLLIWVFVIYFFFPETRGLSIEECSLVFDGHQARSNQANLETVFEQKNGGVEIAHTEQTVPV